MHCTTVVAPVELGEWHWQMKNDLEINITNEQELSNMFIVESLPLSFLTLVPDLVSHRQIVLSVLAV